MITTVSSSTASASTTTSATSNALGQEDFLEILIAQLQNQDPTDPVDTTEFASQLTQYSSLEQLMNVNTGLDTLISDFQSMSGVEMAGLVGMEVTVDGNTIEVDGSTCDISYDLSTSAVEGQVQIYDASGDLIDTLNFSWQDAGANTLVWDCSGQSSGSYTFEVSAVTSDGSDVTVTTQAAGIVTEVSFKDGSSYLKVNGQDVSVDDLISIAQAAD